MKFNLEGFIIVLMTEFLSLLQIECFFLFPQISQKKFHSCCHAFVDREYTEKVHFLMDLSIRKGLIFLKRQSQKGGVRV